MRHSLEPEYKKYIKGYGFLLFAQNFGDKYGKSIINSKNVKKLMDGATKKSKDFAKIAGKKIIHKSAEATGDLVGNKIADKITSMGKPRSKKEKDETNIMEETQEIYIPPEKRKQMIKVSKFITKKWIEVQRQSGSTCNTSKPIRFKTSMLKSDLCDYSDAYVLVKGKITVTNPNDNANFNKELTLKNNAPFISCI